MRFLNMKPVTFNPKLQKYLEEIFSYPIFGGMTYYSSSNDRLLIGIIPEVIVNIDDYNLYPLPIEVKSPLKENLKDLISLEEVLSTFTKSPEIILFTYRNKNPFSEYDHTHFIRFNLLNNTIEKVNEKIIEYYYLHRAYTKIQEEVIDLYWDSSNDNGDGLE